ncbi:MAG: IS4 family transposase [Flavobacterium sp.]|nr:MAG: IS4 family transposase [Flavobacterium sp.]
MNQGKYVFAQLFEIVYWYDFNLCVERYRGNSRVKTFSCWEQFLVMSFAQFSYRESLRDIEYCLESIGSKLYHCGIKTRVSKSTLADANKERNWRIYADYAQILIAEALPLYKGENELCKELNSLVYAFDSTTIDLCLQLFEWAKFRPTKGAVKMHVLLNIDGSIPEFIFITDGSVHDVKIMDKLEYKPGAYYLVDRGYVSYKRLYRIEKEKAFFVTRPKGNMRYEVLKINKPSVRNGIIKDELVQSTGFYAFKGYPAPIRRIEYIDAETGEELEFLTNALMIKSTTIARLYKERWNVELFFKWIKQNLRIKKFYGNNENAVKVQIWIAVCDYLIIAILKKKLKLNPSMNQILQVLSISLFEKMPIKTLFEKEKPNNISNQQSLF